MNFREIVKKTLPNSILSQVKNITFAYRLRAINSQFYEVIEKLEKTKGENRILLVGTAVYGNIGDHAISEAEIAFLEDKFPDTTIIEIPISLYLVKAKLIRKKVHSSDLIIINGGGYLGTLWENGQEMTNSIIENFKANKIIIFPQTVYYKDGSTDLINKHSTIINSHPNLSIIVRDQKSYNFILNSSFKFKNILLTPDIVSYIKRNEYSVAKKDKITFILRKDHEKLDNNEDINKFIDLFEKLGFDDKINFTDSVVPENYTYKDRKKILDSFFNEIGDSKFVVSDRLHGVILSVICGIPVIALDNVSKKVFGAFQWFSELPYVFYYEDERIKEKIEGILSENRKYEYDPQIFEKYHEKIEELVRTELFDD